MTKTAIELHNDGLTYAQIGEALGISREAARSKIRRQKARSNADPAAIAAAQASGSDRVPDAFWVKSDGYSAYFKNDTKPIDILENIKEIFNNVPAVEEYKGKPEYSQSGLMTVYPLFDMHFGMHAWGDETGSQDYDLTLAKQDVKDAFFGLDEVVPNGGDAVIVLGGDTLHVDDSRNETPGSHHKLDSDGRFYKIVDVAIESICWIIEQVAQKHDRVTVRVLRGNHDTHAHVILNVSLSQRYANWENVTIDLSPRDIWYYKHGKSSIGFHHGDKRPPKDLAMLMADECPFWSETKDRHLITGHLHHDIVKQFPGVTCRTVRAFCPPDAYGSMYGSRRGVSAMVFDEVKGLRFVVNEPILRGDG